MADLDAARRHLLVGGHFGVGRRVVHVGGRGILRRPFVDDPLQAGDIVEIYVSRGHRQIEIVLVAEHLRLAGRGQDDEFVD